MIGPFRRTLPNPWFWRTPLMLFCLYVGGWIVTWPLTHMEWVDLLEMIINWGFATILIWSFCVGFYRATAFNPLMKREYYDWIVASSWSEKHPLPHGPMTLVWQDIILVLLLGLPIYYFDSFEEHGRILWLLPALLFASGYLISCILQFFFYARPFAYLTIGLWFIAMAVAPFPHAFFGLILCVIAAEAGLRYIRKRLARGMVGDGKLPKPIMPDVRSMLAGSKRFMLTFLPLGWPHNRLAPVLEKPKIQAWEGTIIALLLALGALCIMLHAGSEVDQVAWAAALIVLLSASVCIARLMLYLTQALPPINFFGRILTGRWIIPKYDVALIPPILIVGIVILFFRDVREGAEFIPMVWKFPLAVFAITWIALCCPPRLVRWRLTAKSRLFPMHTSMMFSTVNQEKRI